MRRYTGSGDVVVSVLTPSIPERSSMLLECRRSVDAQSDGRWEHLVEVDRDRNGCSATMNLLAEHASGEWLLPLADDDLLLPGCVGALLEYADDADVIYPPPLVWGQPQEWFQQAPPVIPSLALIRTSLWRRLGGYTPGLIREEDRDLWIRALADGARFVRADREPTWVYRHHGGNKSFNAGVAS